MLESLSWQQVRQLAPALLALAELADSDASLRAQWAPRLRELAWVPLVKGGHVNLSDAFAPRQPSGCHCRRDQREGVVADSHWAATVGASSW